MTNNLLVTLVVILGFALVFGLIMFVMYRKTAAELNEIRDPALLDGETGLFDSRYFSELTSENIELFERYQAPFTLLIFNIDPKSLNRLRGESKNAVLGRIGSKVKEAIRTSDKAGRPADDAIGILLYNTAGNNAKPVVSRVSSVFNKVMPEARVQVTTWAAPNDIELIRMYVEPNTFTAKN